MQTPHTAGNQNTLYAHAKLTLFLAHSLNAAHPLVVSLAAQYYCARLTPRPWIFLLV